MRRRIVNILLIANILGIVLIFESLFMLFNVVVCLLFDKQTIIPFIESTLLTCFSGCLLFFSTRKQRNLQASNQDSFIIVAASWLFISIYGALPYLISSEIEGFSNAFFESVSGFTTTGSSIVNNIEGLSKGILFWRSLTHWIGGMGIIVLMIAIFPHFKIGAMHLFGIENSLVVVEKLKPKLIDTVKRLWGIYLLITMLETILLKFGGLSWFDSICHAFGTVATGGFSTKNASVAEFSPYVQYIITVFMIFSGINFTLIYQLLKGRMLKVFRNEEIRLYIIILIIIGTIMTASLVKKDIPFEKSFRDSIFQVASILTTTGFATADYEKWPAVSQFLILILMFIGGCAGSTSGSIKIVRFTFLYKKIRLYIQKLIHPNMVKKLIYNGTSYTNTNVNSILSYISTYFFTFIIGVILLMAIGLDRSTSISSIATTMGGIGPGFGLIGPEENFFLLPISAKYILTFYMILGRLEILSVIVIFTRGFWKV